MPARRKSTQPGIRRHQLDRKLGASLLRVIETPKRGYIWEIRNALGMTTKQLAARLGVTQSAVSQLEKSEAAGTISLNSLRKAAEALECTVMYALVPNRPLEEMVRERARKAARKIMERVSHSMSLEDQDVGEAELARQIEDLAYELSRHPNNGLWEDGD